ncbi:MAG: hypothetical protein VB118_04640 [Oscillospiraceae bacterium]|nr:hypothetical protein [Oscillospiraceae bacterium]
MCFGKKLSTSDRFMRSVGNSCHKIFDLHRNNINLDSYYIIRIETFILMIMKYRVAMINHRSDIIVDKVTNENINRAYNTLISECKRIAPSKIMDIINYRISQYEDVIINENDYVGSIFTQYVDNPNVNYMRKSKLGRVFLYYGDAVFSSMISHEVQESIEYDTITLHSVFDEALYSRISISLVDIIIKDKVVLGYDD